MPLVFYTLQPSDQPTIYGITDVATIAAMITRITIAIILLTLLS